MGIIIALKLAYFWCHVSRHYYVKWWQIIRNYRCRLSLFYMVVNYCILLRVISIILEHRREFNMLENMTQTGLPNLVPESYLRFPLHTLLFTLHTLDLSLCLSLYTSLQTLHFTLSTPRFTHYTPQST